VLFIGCTNEKNEIFRNEPEGFRTYKWGTRFDDISDLEKEDSLAKQYSHPYFAAKKKEMKI